MSSHDAEFAAKLLCGHRLSSRLLAIAPVETVHASRGVNQLLLAGKKRMASRTNLNVQITFACRARLKTLATSASHGHFLIFRMNSGFHFLLTFIYSCQLVVSIKQSMIRVATVSSQADDLRD